MLEIAHHTSNCKFGLFKIKLEARWDIVIKQLQLVLQFVCGRTLPSGRKRV